MAHKKGVGSSRNGRDSKPQMRGIKQCGTKVRPGANVGLGRDYTIYSMIDGHVKFEDYSRTQKMVSVVPAEAEA